jgi:hypothetical protein
MTRLMKLPNLTTGLWLGNALGLLLVTLVVASRIGGAVFGSGVRLPPVLPLTAQPVPPPEPGADIGSRNPFDVSAAHWKTSKENNPAPGGELRGVQTVVTSSGTVRLGETLGEGRVARILPDKVIVAHGNVSRELELPSAHRPTLQSINKARSGPHTNKGSK